jgi:hypothetical protein
MSNTRRAIVYTQVSTGAQAESGLGLATSTESAIPDPDSLPFSRPCNLVHRALRLYAD